MKDSITSTQANLTDKCFLTVTCFKIIKNPKVLPTREKKHDDLKFCSGLSSVSGRPQIKQVNHGSDTPYISLTALASKCFSDNDVLHGNILINFCSIYRIERLNVCLCACINIHKLAFVRCRIDLCI